MDRNEATVDSFVRAEANAALTRGGLYAMGLGLSAGTLSAALSLFGGANDLWLPGGFSFVAAVASWFLHRVAKSKRMHGTWMYVAFLPFVSLPTWFFLASHVVMPAGAATYLTGPISYLYLVVIIVTGFVFEPRLSIMAGLVSAVGYLACFVLAVPHLATISAPDPTLRQDLSAAPIYVVKAFMIGASGVFVAGLSVIVRRLLHRVIDEQQKKENISRLFGQYVSEEVKDKILSNVSDLMGERKQVAVLFSDLRGFSTWSEKEAPERVVERLNEYFDAMVGCTAEHGGVVDKFVGDALMAVFGGVLPLDAPAGAALAAARQMRTRLAELNARWEARGLSPLDCGIGIDFGEVLQGNIGSQHRKDFTVIGDTVNTASRLEGLTKQHPFAILVTGEFVAQLSEHERQGCELVGKVKVKGKVEQVEVWGARHSEEAHGKS